ncbi:hypothetical protein [Micromonospora globbae]|uniref:hypothetical protein n=1 Tax=Micromonospora globbae TaxID=1894969 RepID=UPI0011C3761C|nr:hypothetical protein [Micromonospora globbae]
MTMATTPSSYRPLGPADRDNFAQLCQHTREGFEDALDLVLIHNEREVRGRQPRASLNPLIVLLSVAAWERFVIDLKAIARGHFEAAGVYDETRQNDRGARFATAVRVLGPMSAGRLPEAWSVRTFEAWSGKTPTNPYTLTGKETARLEAEVESWRALRNKVAHWCLPQDGATANWRSDAATHTIQSGQARIALSLFLQLVDQAIVALAEAADFVDVDKLRLPASWFSAEPPPGLRGVANPGVLWDGEPLTW